MTSKSKVIKAKRVFETKLNPDGTVKKFKAWLVTKGFTQVQGVDYDETFAPVARIETLRTLINLAIQK